MKETYKKNPYIDKYQGERIMLNQEGRWQVQDFLKDNSKFWENKYKDSRTNMISVYEEIENNITEGFLEFDNSGNNGFVVYELTEYESKSEEIEKLFLDNSCFSVCEDCGFFDE